MIREAKFHGHFINSIRAETALRPHIAIAELIDNALDSGATLIEICFDQSRDLTRISDNGDGCPDVARFFESGSSSAVGYPEKLGRYGVGGTKAAAILCDVEEVHTHHEGLKLSGRMEWTRIADENLAFLFEASDPCETNRIGTDILLYGDRCKVHVGNRANACRNYWSRIYTPALLNNKSIRVNGDPLEPRGQPALKSRIEFVGGVGGKEYRACAGILENEAQARAMGWEPGFNVACSGRLMFDKPAWDMAEDYQGAPVWAYIELRETAGTKWHLDTHKTDFAEREALFTEFVPRISSLLDVAMNNQASHELRVVSEDISYKLATAMGGVAAHMRIKERRASPTNKTGTVEAANTGRTRSSAQKADPTQPGSVVESPNQSHRAKQAWRVNFKEFGVEAGFGEALVNAKCATMNFNLDSAWVRANKNDQSVLIPMALFSIWSAASDKDRTRLWIGLDLKRTEIEEPDPQKRASIWVDAALQQVKTTEKDATKDLKEHRKLHAV